MVLVKYLHILSLDQLVFQQHQVLLILKNLESQSMTYQVITLVDGLSDNYKYQILSKIYLMGQEEHSHLQLVEIHYQFRQNPDHQLQFRIHYLYLSMIYYKYPENHIHSQVVVILPSTKHLNLKILLKYYSIVEQVVQMLLTEILLNLLKQVMI